MLTIPGRSGSPVVLPGQATGTKDSRPPEPGLPANATAAGVPAVSPDVDQVKGGAGKLLVASAMATTTNVQEMATESTPSSPASRQFACSRFPWLGVLPIRRGHLQSHHLCFLWSMRAGWLWAITLLVIAMAVALLVLGGAYA